MRIKCDFQERVLDPSVCFDSKLGDSFVSVCLLVLHCYVVRLEHLVCSRIVSMPVFTCLV